MKKTDELKKAIEAKRSELNDHRQNDRMPEALKSADELERLVDELKLETSLEASNLAMLMTNGTPLTNAAPMTPRRAEPEESDAVLRNRAFNKLLFQTGTLTDAERRAYFNDGSGTTISPALVEGTPSKGGYLVPPEQITTIREFRKAYTALKEYCHVVHANSTSGSWPTLGSANRLLINFTEMDTLAKSDLEFGQATYTINDYGAITPISNQLLADVNVDLIGIIGRDFAKTCINTENKEILSLLQSTLTPTPLTGYKQLTKAMLVDLDPIVYAEARIYTNQDGFNWLSTLEDENKRPLMQPDVTAPDTYRFRGKEIVVLSNAIMTTTSSKAPLYVGNLADFVLFFERTGVEIALSTDAMFDRYATVIRAIERFGVSVDDADAMKAYTVTVT